MLLLQSLPRSDQVGEEIPEVPVVLLVWKAGFVELDRAIWSLLWLNVIKHHRLIIVNRATIVKLHWINRQSALVTPSDLGVQGIVIDRLPFPDTFPGQHDRGHKRVAVLVLAQV